MMQTLAVFISSGVGASLLTEAISWLNNKLVATPLEGDAAFIMSCVCALLFGTIQVAVTGVAAPHSLRDFVMLTSAIWAASQLWFQFIAKKTGLRVSAPAADSTQPLA